MNQELLELAAGQHSQFTAAQAAACGISRSALHRLVKKEKLLVPQPAVFALPGVADSWERSLAAALLAAGPAAVASHRSAARLWDLAGKTDDTLELTVPRRLDPRPKGVVIHRSGDLVDGHVTAQRSFRTTNALRTIVDLGAVLPAKEVEDALDRGLAGRVVSVTGIEWMRHDLAGRGRSGCGVLGRILDHRALGEARPDGLLEPRMARLLRTERLPPAVFQYCVYDERGRFLARVDFAYPLLRLAIEVDGFSVHGTPRAMAKDFVRQNGLVQYGWRVLRFTWHQIVREPQMVAATIRQAMSGLA